MPQDSNRLPHPRRPDLIVQRMLAILERLDKLMIGMIVLSEPV
jgi:hypothetical protein